MKKLLKSLVLLAVLFAGSAFAQDCILAPQIPNTPQRCYDGRLIVGWQNQVNEFGRVVRTPIGGGYPVSNQVASVAPQFIPLQVAQQGFTVPQAQFAQQQLMPLAGQPGLFQRGNQVMRCSMLTQIVGNVIGGYVGNEIGKRIRVGNYHLNIPGAIAGATVGDDIACEIVGYFQQQSAQQVMPQTTFAQAQVATQGLPQVVTMNQGGQQAIPPTCKVVTDEKTYRFNAVNGVKFDKAQCDRYLDKTDPLPPEESMSIIR